MNVFAIAGLSCAISCITLSLIAHFFGKTKLHRLLFVFNIVVAVWGLGLFLIGIADSESNALFSWKFAHAGSFLIGPIFYHIVSVFSGKRSKPLLYFGYLQAIITVVIGVGTDIIFDKTRFVYGLHYYKANPVYVIAVIFYLFFVILSYYILIKHFSKTQGYEHKQTFYIIFGFLFGFIGGTSTFLPMFQIDIIYPFGNFGITLYCVISTYAILRHRLLNLHIVLRKSLIYSISVSFLTGFFIVLVISATRYFSDFAGITHFSITVISALITAVLFAPLKNSIQFVVDKVFFRSIYDHYAIVQKISHELTSTIDLRHIYRLIIDNLFETLKLNNAHLLYAGQESYEMAYGRSMKDNTKNKDNSSPSSILKTDHANESDRKRQPMLNKDSVLVKLLQKKNILVKDEMDLNIHDPKARAIEEEFTRYGCEVVMPIFIDEDPIFILMLGEKLSGFIFSSEDINMLKTIANQAAIALKNAKLYDELENRVEERTAEILKINDDLHKEIIERKRVEEELHNIHKDLELRVEQRTVDLRETNKQLQMEIIERKKTEKQLEYQAFYDQLTDLPNRSLFKTYLRNVLERTKRDENYQFAVLFIDLDRFKVINDSLGHMIGDQLLKAVAQRINECIRPQDIIARFGGDEYAIFLENIRGSNDAIRVANRIQKALMAPFDLSGFEVFITASIGISLSSTGYSREDDIIRDADSAMYRAKGHGRANYEIFDSEMHDSAMKLLQLEADLRRAVKNEDFMVNYQPVVSLKTDRIVGVEALLRWQHPERGFVSPMEFIPLAEETGLISAMGEWILRTACAQNRAWKDAGFDRILMKVNFSVRQFQHKDLLEKIKNVLKETGMPPPCLDVEITESIATEDNCIDVLNELSSMGVHISIDDFGTGYSSMSYLKHLPIDTIKIDKSFVRDLTAASNSEGIVKAIIALAHSLNVKVIAEGVEKEEQKRFLQSYNCDEMQGYLFSRPLSAKELTALLEKESSLIMKPG